VVGVRFLLLGALALSLVSCGKPSDSSVSPDSASSPGFLGAWSQFLEIDTPSSGAPAVPRAARTGSSANSSLTADLDQISEQIRTIYGDAGSYLEGFPAAEETYRSIPTRFQDSVGKIVENKSHADADTIRRRLTQMTTQVNEVIERQHIRFSTLETTRRTVRPLLTSSWRARNFRTPIR
jgi:hypothetical protein